MVDAGGGIGVCTANTEASLLQRLYHTLLRKERVTLRSLAPSSTSCFPFWHLLVAPSLHGRHV